MAKVSRPKPKRLPEKLKQIRDIQGFSQSEMLNALGLSDLYDRSVISGYETGYKEPPLPTILKYARLVSISTDILIDDDLNLPQKLKK